MVYHNYNVGWWWIGYKYNTEVLSKKKYNTEVNGFWQNLMFNSGKNCKIESILLKITLTIQLQNLNSECILIQALVG